MTTVLTLGEPLVTFTLDDANPPHVAAHVAGAELNTAVGLARQGVTVRWFSRAADDALAELVADTLSREGIDASAVLPAPGERTGLIVKKRIDDHEMRSEHYRAGSATSRLTAADLPADRLDALLDGVDRLHVTGITPSLGEGPRAAWTALVRAARDRGVPISLDVNHREQLVDRATIRDIVHDVLDHVDTLLCNEEEALVLAGATTIEEALASLIDGSPRTVIVKLGRRGAIVGTPDGRRLECGAWPVTPPTHPVGAGDSFNAGWIAAELAGVPVEVALPFSAWVASRVVADPGDHDGFPSAAECAATLAALARGDLVAPGLSIFRPAPEGVSR